MFIVQATAESFQIGVQLIWFLIIFLRVGSERRISHKFKKKKMSEAVLGSQKKIV
jgi:hypothetical protein